MNDPEALKFLREQVRPLAEAMEASQHRFDVAMTLWNGGISTLYTTPPQSEIVDDGRKAEGVSQLTCFQVIQFIEQMAKTSTGGPNEWNHEIINKPTVRVFEAK